MTSLRRAPGAPRLVATIAVVTLCAGPLLCGACEGPASPGPAAASSASAPTSGGSPARPLPTDHAAPEPTQAPGADNAGTGSGPPPEVARPYDESADADADVAAALARAARVNRRVLLVFGANWCPWCRRLEHTLTTDPTLAMALASGFEVVHVDTGARRSGKNAALAARYGDATRLGLPALAVLSADGTLLATQETGSLEVGDRHDPLKIGLFLASMASPSAAAEAPGR